MSTLYSMLTPVPGIVDDETQVFHDAEVRAKATEVHLLGKHGNDMLAVRVEDDGFKVSFALLTFHTSDAGGANTTWTCIANGEGYAGNLRELRHTWWGGTENGGYIFYPPMRAIAQAMEILGKWFDEP